MSPENSSSPDRPISAKTLVTPPLSSAQNLSWNEAWNASPGPRSRQETLMLFLKGICMGTADIIPGVSGGTIAFVTGIYQILLDAIASINIQAVLHLSHFNLKLTVAAIHVRVLIPLFTGILLAIISTARLMHYLMAEHAILTWSLFFGLIASSILVVSKEIRGWIGTPGMLVLLGTFVAYFIVGVIPVQTPETWWFILLSGVIAICAMILPGLSGSFILLILGKYEFITSALKNPFDLHNLVILAVFASGCVIGLLGFSRVLSYFLKNYYSFTMAVLAGFMIGAMRKVWPWKEVLETKIIRGKEYILQEQNILPNFDGHFALALGVMAVGFCMVLLLEKWARTHTPSG